MFTPLNSRTDPRQRPSDPRLGRVLAEKYRIDALLGEGAIGVVYRGVVDADQSEVAIKFLHPPWAKVAEYRARFVREAQLLAKLKHPCVVQVIDFGNDGETPYLVMELLHGQTLRTVMQQGLLSFERIVHILSEVLSLLVLAHSGGIVHRDLKPDNVMLLHTDQSEDVVKVFDFGLAFVDDQPSGQRLTEPNSVRGTPRYMAPEQCRGRPITPASDVYSVGIMLYELLVGRAPFGDEGSTDVMAQHVFVPPPPMENYTEREIPTILEEVTLSALQKLPELRPTAAELRQSLLHALRGLEPQDFRKS